MKKLFNRVSDVPILTPDPTSNWECVNVFNPAVIYHRGLFHMLYRAQGGDFVSRLGYAVSEDGIHWNRLRQPVFVPEEPREAWGVEDPRIVELEGCFYMTYTAFGPPRNGAILAVADAKLHSSPQFSEERAHGPCCPDLPPKARFAPK